MHNFKVGDKIRIKDDCKITCFLNKSQKGETGYIIGIFRKYIFVKIPAINEVSWAHYNSCLEKVDTGFDPDEIINKSFKTRS